MKFEICDIQVKSINLNVNNFTRTEKNLNGFNCFKRDRKTQTRFQ